MLNDNERKDLFTAAQQVWNEIGYDVLQAVAEDKRKDINTISIPRSEVIELVVDAGRLEETMKRAKTWTPAHQTLFDDYKKLCAELKKTFTFTRYGM